MISPVGKFTSPAQHYKALARNSVMICLVRKRIFRYRGFNLCVSYFPFVLLSVICAAADTLQTKLFSCYRCVQRNDRLTAFRCKKIHSPVRRSFTVENCTKVQQQQTPREVTFFVSAMLTNNALLALLRFFNQLTFKYINCYAPTLTGGMQSKRQHNGTAETKKKQRQ
jgi:hypothetical protein